MLGRKRLWIKAPALSFYPRKRFSFGPNSLAGDSSKCGAHFPLSPCSARSRRQTLTDNTYETSLPSPCIFIVASSSSPGLFPAQKSFFFVFFSRRFACWVSRPSQNMRNLVVLKLYNIYETFLLKNPGWVHILLYCVCVCVRVCVRVRVCGLLRNP